MVSPSKHFSAFINNNMIFQNYHSEKLVAENICKTTTCKEHYPHIHNEDDSYDFLMLLENHIKVSIVIQQEISHKFEVIFKLYKVTGSNKKDKIGDISLKIDPASNNCKFSLSPTNHGPSNKQAVSKEVPLG